MMNTKSKRYSNLTVEHLWSLIWIPSCNSRSAYAAGITLLLSRLRTLGVVSDNLNFTVHGLEAEAGDADHGHDGLVIGHPGLAVAEHVAGQLVADVGQVDVDAVDLRPALAAGVLEGHVDVGKGLVGFFGQVRADLASGGVPSAFSFVVVSLCLEERMKELTRRKHRKDGRGNWCWLVGREEMVLTLSCAFDAVSQTDSLAIPVFFSGHFAEAFVRVVGKMCHFCNLNILYTLVVGL